MDSSERKTIVVVDDMTTILEHAKMILKESYRVVPCTSGAQALEIINKIHPNLVLVDVNMPEMDGFEVLSSIKSNPATADLNVILITTELSSDIEERGFELGADDFIIKPFAQTSMLKRISKIIG